MKQLYNYLYEGLLDIEDTINNNDDIYTSVIRSEKFLKHFEIWDAKTARYESDVLKIHNDLDICPQKEVASFFDYLPSIKRVECENSITDMRGVISDKNTPSEVAANYFGSFGSEISNIRFDVGRGFSTTANKLKNVNVQLKEYNGGARLFLTNKFSKFDIENFSTNATDIEIPRYYWGDNFEQLNDLIDPTCVIDVRDRKKNIEIEYNIKNYKKLHALFNQNKKYFIPISTCKQLGSINWHFYVKFKNGANLFKTLGFKDCPNLERILIKSPTNCVLRFFKKSNRKITSENPSTTVDGWCCMVYKI